MTALMSGQTGHCRISCAIWSAIFIGIAHFKFHYRSGIKLRWTTTDTILSRALPQHSPVTDEQVPLLYFSDGRRFIADDFGLLFFVLHSRRGIRKQALWHGVLTKASAWAHLTGLETSFASTNIEHNYIILPISKSFQCHSKPFREPANVTMNFLSFKCRNGLYISPHPSSGYAVPLAIKIACKFLNSILWLLQRGHHNRQPLKRTRDEAKDKSSDVANS